MRVMVIVKATKDSEAGVMPSAEMLAEMGKFNEELVNAGVMQAGDGVHPSSKGVRIRFDGDKRTVEKGPFGNPEELLAGFWIWKVSSLDEAIEWAKKCPNPDGSTGGVLELRPFFEMEDFGAELTPELREQEARLRAKVESQS